MKKGFTLIEMVIYIALFSLVIGGGIVATYQIIDSGANGANHVVLQEEANFLLRKINWALTGGTLISTGSTLVLDKNGTNYTFDLDGGSMRLKEDSGAPLNLNSSSIVVSGLNFSDTPIGTGVVSSFTLTTSQDGRDVTQNFSTTKYFRQ